jgi:subtilisin family serine protease
MMKGYITTSFFILLSGFAAFAQTGPVAEYAKGSIYFKIKDIPSVATVSNFNGTYSEDGETINPIEPSSPPPPAWQQILTKYKSNSATNPFPYGGALTKNVYEANFNENVDLDLVMQELLYSGMVEYVERVPVFRLCAAPSDLPPNSFNTHYFDRIKINIAWSYQSSAIKPVVIAVIDGPIRATHEDLVANLWENPREKAGKKDVDDDHNGIIDDIHGADVGDGDNNTEPLVFTNPTEDDLIFGNHGTQVAGIACATTDNSLGIPSLGFNARLMVVKATKDSDPLHIVSGGINGIYYAINSGADIINISWGTHDRNASLEAAIKAATKAGVIVIAAAGNFGNNHPFYPAAFDGVIAVGASYIEKDNKWGDGTNGSNYGDYIDVMAPGVNIHSCLAFAPDGSPSSNSYGNETGTSMSSPLVAGFASLILSLNPQLTAAEVEQIIKKGCDPLITDQFFINKLLGAGRINVDKSLEILLSTGEAPDQKSAFNIYPNPSNGNFYISFGAGDLNKYTVSICDLQGREIFSESGSKTSEDLQIQIPQMEKGLYLVRLQTGDQSLMVKRISVY